MIIIMKMSFIIDKVDAFSWKIWSRFVHWEKIVQRLPCDPYILWKLFIVLNKTKTKPNVYNIYVAKLQFTATYAT